MSVRCFVAGTPAPQGSKSLMPNGSMIESSRAVKPWREAVVAQVREALGGDHTMLLGPVKVSIMVWWKRPQSHYGSNGKIKASAPIYVATKPDGDKLGRSTLDALVSAGVMRDDCLVADLRVIKLYTTEQRPVVGALIDVRSLA